MVSHSGLITVMQRAARKAAPRLRRDFGEVEHLQVSRKGPADFVSMADKRAEETLIDELRNARASLFRHLGIPAHDARDRVGRDACPPRDVGERDLLSCGSGRGHGLLHWLR